MRVRLEGRHSGVHCGSAAVWNTLRRMAVQKGWRIARPGEPYDALVVNGEGSMHHSSPNFQKKIQLLAEALELGKAAYLVNTVWQCNTNEHDEILRRLSGISVREIFSQRELSRRHGIRSRLCPDVSFSAPISLFARPRILFGITVATDFYLGPGNGFGRPDYARRFPEIAMTGTWATFVRSLQTAKLLVTGRHHAVYGACRARTPFAAIEGNTHKIAGLLASAGVSIPLGRSVSELPDVLSEAPKAKADFRKLFAWLRAQDFRLAFPAPGETWPVEG
jgi:hypothetical protein